MFPTPSYTWLHRPRLLNHVPEERGYVLRLEAPYGFGKSVLLAQAAAHLGDLGFRVVALRAGQAAATDLLGQLATELGVAADWPQVTAAIQRQPTALLLDDLTAGAGIEPLLRAPSGPLLLASREALHLPALLTLQAEGRLTSLYAAQLAFDRAEAGQLIGVTAGQHNTRPAGPPKPESPLWDDTLGWPLALHLSALHLSELHLSEVQSADLQPKAAPAEGNVRAEPGSAATEATLRRGLEESLPAAQMRQLRVAAALNLPGLSLPLLGDLRGMVTESGQPSPLIGRLLSRGDATEDALRRELPHLPADQRGAAYERLGWRDELALLLESSPGLGQQVPEAVMRWDDLAPSGGPARALEAAWAYVRAGHAAEGGTRFGRIAHDPRATPAQQLEAYGNAVFYLAESDLERAQALADEAEPLLAGAEAHDQALFLNRVSHLDYLSGQLQRGVQRLERALTLMPAVPRKRLRSNIVVNLAMQRWWLDGDSDAHLAVRERELTTWGDELPAAVRLVHRWNLGVTALLSGLPAEARRHFSDALRDGAAQPLYALHCRCYLALLEGRLGEMPALWAEVQSYADPESEDRIACSWALELLRQGRAAEALRRLEGQSGEMVQTIRALVLQQAGDEAQALEALPARLDPGAEREKCLYVLATRYRVTRDPAELDALCALNTEGSRVLTTFVPAAELPRDRPELGVHFPLEDLLALGWKEALLLRQAELPLLELNLLGGFEVRVLGKPVVLTGRPREILVLSALGQSRSTIAETLWPGLEAEKSRNNLHVNLNLLRRGVEPWGFSTYLSGDGLHRCACDLWRLQAAMAAGDWPQVRASYRPLVPGLELPPVHEFREGLAAQVMGGALRHSSGLPPREAAGWADWALSFDPLNEEAMEQLLCALLASGQRVTAERRYQDYARALDAALKLRPSQTLARLLNPAPGT